MIMIVSRLFFTFLLLCSVGLCTIGTGLSLDALVTDALVVDALRSVNIEDYLKKAGEKTGNHGLRNVDCAYIINLDQRPEKLKSCTDQLSPYGIFPCRFSAVNGWELSLETVNALGVKYEPSMRKELWGTSYLPGEDWMPHHEVMTVEGRNYFCHCMARGPIGIVLSHLSVLKDAYDAGH